MCIYTYSYVYHIYIYTLNASCLSTYMIFRWISRLRLHVQGYPLPQIRLGLRGAVSAPVAVAVAAKYTSYMYTCIYVRMCNLLCTVYVY